MKNKKLTAIVVEDERLPRLALLQKLEDLRSQVEVVDSCDTYDRALQSIVRNRPQLLFLDIQLQGHDTLELLNELQQSMALPLIIFTTAYDNRQYLMSAIKFAAVDYLMKPIDKTELALAITKAQAIASGELAMPDDNGRLSFRTTTGRLFVETSEVAYIRADGNYAHVFTFATSELVMDSLGSLEKRLNADVFVRADRSTIVNVKRVYKINAKRRTCTLLSLGGKQVDMELSKAGIDNLLNIL